jgi:hypothetical protein
MVLWWSWGGGCFLRASYPCRALQDLYRCTSMPRAVRLSYRGTSLVWKTPTPSDQHRALCIGLVRVQPPRAGCFFIKVIECTKLRTWRSDFFTLSLITSRKLPIFDVWQQTSIHDFRFPTCGVGTQPSHLTGVAQRVRRFFSWPCEVTLLPIASCKSRKNEDEMFST